MILGNCTVQLLVAIVEVPFYGVVITQNKMVT